MDYDKLKRIMDVGIALVASLVFSPLLILTAILIKITSPGPVFADTPKRLGRGGKLFRLYKFRSMIVNAYKLLKTDPRFKKAYEEQQRGGRYKIKNDPRVTPFGRFIRKYSIDEFPQFVNVVKGDMSVVGPRPYYSEELKRQQKSYPETKQLVKQALSVKPGITGLWQVSGRSELPFDKRIALDAYYAKTKSFWLDLLILFKTPWAVLQGRGAV